MVTLSRSATTVVAGSHSFPGSLWRAFQTWSDELDRAVAAARRYEDLTIRQNSDAPLRYRGAKARQVFLEMYSDI